MSEERNQNKHLVEISVENKDDDIETPGHISKASPDSQNN